MIDMLPNCPICGAVSDWHEYDTPDEYGVICCAPSSERCPMMMDGPITEATWRALARNASRLSELIDTLRGLQGYDLEHQGGYSEYNAMEPYCKPPYSEYAVPDWYSAYDIRAAIEKAEVK